MKNKFLFFYIIIILSCFITISHADSDEDKARVDRKLYRIFDDIDLIYASKISYATNRITIKTVYPKLISEMPNETVEIFNQKVDDLIKEESKAFKNQVAENKTTQQNLPKNLQNNDMEIDFNASTINANKTHLLSVRFTIQQYLAGAAHPKHFHRVINFDADDNEVLSLNDLFREDADYLEVISAFSKRELSRHLHNKEMIAEGTQPVEENFKNWNLKPEGILFTFDEYQVAPYVFGTQSVLVPYRFLKGMIPKTSPIAACARTKRKCGWNNLLTGGFIDEALNTHHSRFNPSFG